MYGLVLEGGGAKGSYQIGAYKALREMDIEINGASGTSVGAINSALILQNDWDKAYNLWYNINLSRLFDIDEEILNEIKELNFNHNNIRYIYKKLKHVLNNRGIDLKKIRNILQENIDEDAIRKSGKDFGMVTVNLSEMEPVEIYIEDIPEGSLVDYLIASSYLPTFKMEKMNGSYYLDGGFYNNLPVSLMSEKGYKDIIAIRTFGMGRVRDIDNDDELNITYISPDEDLGGTLDFNQDKIRHNIDLGYHDALRVFKGLKGTKYYINSDNISPDCNESDGSSSNPYPFLDYFLQLDKKQMNEVGQILNIEEISGRRMLLEEAVPKLVTLLQVDDDCKYEDIIIALMEYAADKYDIERFKIYQLDELNRKIREKVKEKEETETVDIPDFVRHNDILSRAVSNQILDEVIKVIFN